jgi:DNA-binding NarL/FixJ family response regulator
MEGVKIYEEREGAIDLLLVEAVMSRINGHELADMLQSKDPTLRVIFLADSDYVRLVSRVAAQKGLTFVPRRFTMSILATKVREILDAPAPPRVMAAGGIGM